MGKKRFAPAPWELDTAGWPLTIFSTEVIKDGDEAPLIATVDLPEGSVGDDEAGLQAVAHARLVAAAPELLAALREAQAWNNADIRGFDDITPNREMLLARRSVLAKAIKKVTQ